ncbi:MAG: hypothetical protein ACYCZN_12865 [Candidatus Dormibacteria bacterium]
MIGIAAAGGVTVGAAITLLVRRERSLQLLALGLMSLAVAVALLLAGAVLPSLAVLVLGVVAQVAMMSPLSRPFRADHEPAPLPPAPLRTSVGIAALAAVAAFALLVGAGVAGRVALSTRPQLAPSLVDVSRHLLLGTGVGVLGLLILAAAVMVGTSTLVGRDRREQAEEQAEAARRRRTAQQQRRAEQREAARAAARAARRGASR